MEFRASPSSKTKNLDFFFWDNKITHEFVDFVRVGFGGEGRTWHMTYSVLVFSHLRGLGRPMFGWHLPTWQHHLLITSIMHNLPWNVIPYSPLFAVNGAKNKDREFHASLSSSTELWLSLKSSRSMSYALDLRKNQMVLVR